MQQNSYIDDRLFSEIIVTKTKLLIFQSVIVIQKVQLQTFVMWRLVNAFAKMALEAQGVINVHLDFSKISIYLSSNVILAIVLSKDQPQKYAILQMADVHAKKIFQAEHALQVNT